MAHSVFLGRIRQIGLDADTNYSIQSTSAYDSLDPAGTPAALPANENVFYDQDLITTVPPGSSFTHEGLLFTFERRCSRFWGVLPKISAVFDESVLNTSALEFWTHSSLDSTWTLQNRILLNDPFRGTRSGRAKFFDMRLAVALQGIDKVWITIAVASGYTVHNDFIAVHLFGACHDRIETPGDCHADPTIECIDPGPCATDEACLTPPLDCTNYAPSVCDTPPFDWPTIPPDAGGPTPPSEPPVLPLVDLCDPVALQAFKDSMTPDQLAYFEDLLAHTELPCFDPDKTGEPKQKLPINDPQVLPRQPIETYVDPKTGEYIPDPRNPEPQDPAKQERGFRKIVTFTGTDFAKAASFAGANVPALITTDPSAVTDGFNYGPVDSATIVGTFSNPLPYGFRIKLDHLPSQCRIGLRVRSFRFTTAAIVGASPPLFPTIVMDSIGYANGAAGIRSVADPIPAAPPFVDFETSWVDNLSPGLLLTPYAQPFLGNGYFEFSFLGSHRHSASGHDASIILRMPRLDPGQNDAIDHTASTKPRSAFGRDLRGYCRYANIFHDPAAREKDIWLPDASLADIAADGGAGGRFEGANVVCFVVDVIVRTRFTSDAFTVQDVTLVMNTTDLTGTQEAEDCSP
jgi:hypothetical protein